MRRVAVASLVLLAGLAGELWLTFIGMSEAFSGGIHPAFSFAGLGEDWQSFGLTYGLPVVAVSFGILAVQIWMKKPTDASDK